VVRSPSLGGIAGNFSDKHLSWNWEWARKMYDTSRELHFPFMAGSSLPVTWRTPSVEMPLGARISEALCVCYGGVDSYDFHGLETIQCMVERRHGGETGVEWVQAYRGDKFWDALREGVDWQFDDFGSYLDFLVKRGVYPNVASFCSGDSFEGSAPDAWLPAHSELVQPDRPSSTVSNRGRAFSDQGPVQRPVRSRWGTRDLHRHGVRSGRVKTLPRFG